MLLHTIQTKRKEGNKMNTAMRMNTKAPGWSPMKCFEVDAVIKAAAYTYMRGDKDDFADVLAKVEKDTGYEIDLIYDIFVEQIEDEREDNQDIDSAIGAAAYHTITSAYELDY